MTDLVRQAVEARYAGRDAAYSVEVMSLVMALTGEFDIEITPLDLKEENFHTARAIESLVARLQEE